METTMQNYIFFLQVMGELKITQLKRAYTLSTNSSFGREGRVCTIAKWWDLIWNPAFCDIKSNSIA
mgnify:CR=1 FL=1